MKSNKDLFLKNHIDRDSNSNYLEVKYTINDLVSEKIIENIPSREEILFYIEERAKNRFGDFVFRKNQKETICEIILSFFNNVDNFILQAPTGSGKSIIALLVSDVLQYYFDLSGYILVSDLGLLRQYGKDIIKNFKDFAILEGQNNYYCDENNMPFNMGFCKMSGYKSYNSIITSFTCAETCPYICARQNAIDSKVVLTTYQGWFTQRNYVAEIMGADSIDLLYPFKQRDFIICDEAHKITEIFQQQFAPTISFEDVKKINNIIINVIAKTSKYISVNDSLLNKQLNSLLITNDNEKLFNYLKEYRHYLKEIEEVLNDLVISFKKVKKLNTEAKILLNNCMWFNEYANKIKEYIKIIDKSGYDCIVKNKIDNNTIVLYCLDEELIMKEHFHNRIGNCLYMSATIGEINNYCKNVHIEKGSFLDIPSNFDFTKSPIYYINKYKLSYDKKEFSLPKILNIIEEIINSRNNYKGIIQTGSYEFSKYLYDNIFNEYKDRIILYEDTNDKRNKLEEFEDSKNKILVGPSLIEGIDLKDDLCRFIIIMKIPYPSLGDKFVAKKFEVDKNWYMWKTTNSILQGVGRGVRNENDWCETYIVDGTFDNILLNYSNLIPFSFANRIKNISEYF